MTFLRNAYNYDTNAASLDSALYCYDPTRTDQSFAEEVDINTIIRNFGLNGTLPENLTMPRDGDFSDSLDYQQSLNLIILANRSFMELPADVRSRFGNNAENFVTFASDPKNLDECRKLGLADPVKLPVPPLEVRIAVDPTQVKEAVKGLPNAPQSTSGL
jgi:phage internal scaffolding protein